jgi:hypothetical protein
VKLLSNPDVAKHGGIAPPDTTMTFSLDCRFNFQSISLSNTTKQISAQVNSTGK